MVVAWVGDPDGRLHVSSGQGSESNECSVGGVGVQLLACDPSMKLETLRQERTYVFLRLF